MSFPRQDQNVAHVLWDRRDSAAPAVVHRGETVTFTGLRARAAAIAEGLSGGGLAVGGRVGIYLDRGADAAASFFGTVAAGGVAINMNETLRPRQIEHMLGHSGADYLLTTREVLSRQPRPLDTQAEIVELAELPSEGVFEPVDRIGEDIAQIIYTSGSTGLPKGVVVSHGNLWAGMRSVTSYLGLEPTDRIASLLPFSFDYGFNQLMCALGVGATLVVERSPLPATIVSTLREEDVSVLAAVPPLWLQLLGTPGFREPLPALRIMTNTGGRIPTDAVRSLRKAQPDAELYLMYGLTEAFRATYLPPEEVDRRPDSIGKAIPGSEIMVLAEDGRPCEAGETGELVQRGATVALGYWRDPEATARVYRPNPRRPEGTPAAERVVYSGDLVRRDEEGFLYFVSRRDRMIKTLGFRVSPDEVSEILFASGEVAEGVVWSEPDPQRGERIVAQVVLKTGGSVARVEDFCKREAPRYMWPARIEVVDDIPRTASGKHDARAASGGQSDEDRTGSA